MIFWKTSEVAKEEARLAELKKLHDERKITTGEYLDAINNLKQTGDGGGSSTTNVLNIVQMGLLLGVVVAGVYVIRIFKK